MALTSALEVIKGAMLRVGVLDPIEQPTAEQVAVCLDALNALLDGLQTSAMAGGTVEHSATLAGQSLTIGPAQQIDTPRPVALLGAFCRIAGTDRQIEVIGRAEWDAIDIKGLGSVRPEVCWYDAALPFGVLRFWPIPAAPVEVHLTLSDALQPYALATGSQWLGQGLKRALVLALALEVCPIFGTQPSPQLLRDAANAMRVYKRTQADVPQLFINSTASAEAQFFAGGQL